MGELMQYCPKCGGRCPTSHFVYKDTIRTECRVCRNREKMRVRSAMKRKLELLVAAERRREARARGRDLDAAKLRLFRRYMAVVARLQYRIKVLSSDGVVTQRRLKLLSAKKHLLSLYEQTHARQIDMLERGFDPPDIVTMINDIR